MTPKKMNITLKIVLATLVVATLVGLFFANKKLTETAQDTARLKAEVEIAQKQIDSYSLTKVKVESLDYVNELAAKVLPAEEDQSALVAEMTQFALRSNLTITQLSFAEAKAVTTGKDKKSAVPSGVSITPISLAFSPRASYTDVLEFLQTLENNQRKTQVTNITLTPDGEDSSRLSQVSIELNVYTKKAVQKSATGLGAPQ